MRSRLPAVLLLVLSAFLLGPTPAADAGAAHPPAAATLAAWWGEPSGVWWSGPSEHAVQHAVLPRTSLSRGVPAPPLWPAVLPSAGLPEPPARPVAAAPRSVTPAPRPAARAVAARAPPSTTR
ncbi:hypothetical protein [Nonomuraea sp. NPDC050783]|uniref:hypothetical protein n=1 Tax=Nonomuraea sp. NPDC050783 TaxID=3154634 RepID=UPI00346701C5